MRKKQWILVLTPAIAAGCSQHREIVEYPSGSLKVRFMPADDYTDCLVASIVMCANYLRGHNRFDSREIRKEMAAAGLNHTRVDGVSQWLSGHRMRMVPIRGELSDEPPRGVAWWILSRGHPVICVVNKHGDNADYNHAVVIIGVEVDADGQIVAVDVLDPASADRLERWPRSEFEGYWSRTNQAMLPLFESPSQTARVAVDQRWRES